MYRLTENECIERVSDGAHIPPDPDNRDYAQYLAWVAAGNETCARTSRAVKPNILRHPFKWLSQLKGRV